MSPRAVHRGRRGPSSEPEGTLFLLTTSNAILWLCRELPLPWVTPGRSWGRRKRTMGIHIFLSCWAAQTLRALPPLTRGLQRSKVLEFQVFRVSHNFVHCHSPAAALSACGMPKGSPSLDLYLPHPSQQEGVKPVRAFFSKSRAPDLHVPLLLIHGVNCCCNNMLYHKQYSSSLC